jgi:hypothetical protein
MDIRILLLMLAFYLFGCQAQPQEEPTPITAESFQTGPQLVKIKLDSPETLHNLEAQNVEIIVREEDYVIARLDLTTFSEIQNLSLSIQKPADSDLVQRLIAVVVSDSTQVAEVNNSGVDIWEMRGDSVIAQAFDKQIDDIKAMGLQVAILEDDIQNLVKKISQK